MMTDKRYQVILCDPPWQYTSKSVTPSREVVNHYQTMTHADICALPVRDIADDRAALFIWAVWPMIDEALAVIKAWGFVYKTLAWEWIKMNQNNMGIAIGMGAYTRSNPEPCLLAFRGDPLPVAVHDVTSVIMSPLQEHSRKPEVQYNRIEALYPSQSKIELFARRRRAGWDAFGNQVDGSIALPAAARLAPDAWR